MIVTSVGRPIEILLVEDDPGDVKLTREALRENRLKHNLGVVTDGVEAMRYLRREGDYAGSARPDLVLLDLNLPRMDGRAVLKELKNDPLLRSLPIVVLTTSRSEEDIVRTYDLHVNCYIAKPLGLEEFIKAVNAIATFWFCVAELPMKS
ncbi:MAG TPA: response regulator [Kiritimatiellia bacterium]|jgi:CheY-like chemotaxis protein